MELIEAKDAYLQYLHASGYSDSHMNTVAQRLNRFVAAFDSGIDVISISNLNVSAYFRRMERSGLADATLAGHLATLRAFWNWLVKAGEVNTSPLVHMKSYSYRPVRRQAAPLDDVIRVAQSLPAFAAHRGYHPRDVRDALIVSLALDNGGRVGEIASILLKDLEHALQYSRQTKNGRCVYRLPGRGKTGDQPLRFFGESAQFAQHWLDISPWPHAGHVCINLETGKRMTTNSVSRLFVRVCEFSGVQPFRPHALRKRNVSDLIQMTGDVKAGQLYAHHTSAETTLRHYDDIDQEYIDDVAAELAEMRRRPADLHQLNKLFGIGGASRR
ncbi:MAG: tyrosine-type recombinase/integrase [Ardenticatenaceae bacterium]|nr:tyrosine-type recombinase/integrase [Anaerolineales bacterium]MCB8923040.1 tyrosine-type recombinase/integrase [Ardenticatenaceae bacterium]